MEIESMTAQEALEWACSILKELCEETENDPVLSKIAKTDTEWKTGAFARGRIHEAKAIRDAMTGATRLLLGDAPTSIPPPPRAAGHE